MKNQDAGPDKKEVSAVRGNLYKKFLTGNDANLNNRAVDHSFSKNKIFCFLKLRLQLYFLYLANFTEARRWAVQKIDLRLYPGPIVLVQPIVPDMAVERFLIRSLYFLWFLDSLKLGGRPRAQ